MAINIKQITNFDLKDKTPYPQNAPIRGDSSLTRNMSYKYISFPTNIKKFSYCCEPKAIIYPLKLVFPGGITKWFQIGKTGMFEVQSENFKDINDDTSEIITIETPVQGIYIPWQYQNSSSLGFNFTLEYIIEL